jgi:hypothetical protein
VTLAEAVVLGVYSAKNDKLQSSCFRGPILRRCPIPEWSTNQNLSVQDQSGGVHHGDSVSNMVSTNSNGGLLYRC